MLDSTRTAYQPATANATNPAQLQSPRLFEGEHIRAHIGRHGGDVPVPRHLHDGQRIRPSICGRGDEGSPQAVGAIAERIKPDYCGVAPHGAMHDLPGDRLAAQQRRRLHA